MKIIKIYSTRSVLVNMSIDELQTIREIGLNIIEDAKKPEQPKLEDQKSE